MEGDALSAMLCLEARAYYYREMRNARDSVLRDAEQFTRVITVLENLGKQLGGRGNGLRAYSTKLITAAASSPLAFDIVEQWPEIHVSFSAQLETLAIRRNNAVHEGAFARNLARDAAGVACVLEDALKNTLRRLEDVMIRNPAQAEGWQPVSLLRQTMLLNSFSYLPFFYSEKEIWVLISDHDLVTYLGQPGPGVRASRLAKKLDDALQEGLLVFREADLARRQDPVSSITGRGLPTPILVVSEDKGALLGLVAPFDLL